ncbi:MAG: hypothetical protein HQ546_07380 [Planctomycetes bacterium]|nr:hypothetical protein [Planctomycetota bacterium]
MTIGKQLALAGLLIGSVLAGCNDRRMIDTGDSGRREVAAPDVLVARASSPVTDLAVPLGFKLDEKNSRSMATVGIRSVEHRYTGRADKWAVGRFFKRQMPLAQWTLLSDRMSEGTIHLTFSNGRELCELEIGDRALYGTVIWANIYPTARSSGAPR